MLSQTSSLSPARVSRAARIGRWACLCFGSFRWPWKPLGRAALRVMFTCKRGTHFFLGAVDLRPRGLPSVCSVPGAVLGML